MNKVPDRCGFVALIGAPNAGKSTLINALVGAKVAIVTHKVQTTRSRIIGIAIEGRSQLVFVDTPGIFEPRRRLDRAMVSAAWKGAKDADVTALLIDAAKGYVSDAERIVEGLKKSGNKAILLLNKIDLVKRERLLGLTAELDATGVFSETFMISALKGHGLADFKTFLAKNLPEGPWLYPEDQLSDIAERLLAAEITREQVYLRLHQELPYHISVAPESWEVGDDGSIRIEQIIHVQRSSQKGMVIGKKGAALKGIGVAARIEMEKVFDARVHLFLFVKVSEKWADQAEHYAKIGLDFVK
ncbi:MAG: GTPase Era [Sphingomonadales bacterium]